MSKKFKLVYEDNGVIKGSYSGIPAKSDASLIERSVLEGSKPAPTPDEPIDNEKSFEALKQFIEYIVLLEDKKSYKAEKIFNFKNCPFSSMDEFWINLDAESVQWIHTFIEQEAMLLEFNCSMTLPAYASSENSLTFFNVANSYAEPTSYCSISWETDAETGDSWVVTAFPDESFSGSLRISYDGSKYHDVWDSGE